MDQVSQNALFFQVSVRTPDGGQSRRSFMEFSSVEAACCDVVAAIPDVAADMLRDGIDPMQCAYLIYDEHGTLLMEVPFTDLLRTVAKRPDEPVLPPHPSASGSAVPDDALLARSAFLREIASAARDRSTRTIQRCREISAAARLLHARGQAEEAMFAAAIDLASNQSTGDGKAGRGSAPADCSITSRTSSRSSQF
jgi:hypothetical protein